MNGELLRVLWTAVGITASLTGLLAVCIMLWLSRDAERTAWALDQLDPRRGLALERLHAHGDFKDSVALVIAANLVFLVATAMAGAGIAGSFEQGLVALLLLIASEVLVLGSEIALLVLGFMKWRRRNAILSAAAKVVKQQAGGAE